ncbi:chaperone DnaJ-domain superfamily protein [Klebsormidium nitens]|uniref:Chaperone DnaJ-domain superfamily protein n=1 Tax=Klebsormidium nitens TaxID=105231 RepID=A0A1Y1IBX5_KLENI|nr:chaperone DnaJ-domain superfamily protein [Klebsormidium nitens]|eukprot:GAQ88083.1 chaperone DnaJ-domain superfamily protein [Klebsormidium nitens]
MLNHSPKLIDISALFLQLEWGVIWKQRVEQSLIAAEESVEGLRIRALGPQKKKHWSNAPVKKSAVQKTVKWRRP